MRSLDATQVSTSMNTRRAEPDSVRSAFLGISLDLPLARRRLAIS